MLTNLQEQTEYSISLGDGTHTIAVKDVYCFGATISVVLTQPSAVEATWDYTPPACYEPSVTSQIVATGGAPSYTYTLESHSVTDGTFLITTSGVHNATVMDSNGCSIWIALNASIPTPLVLSVTPTPLKCGAPGSIIATASGGSPPYVYSLNGTTSPTGSWTGLTYDYYLITVTDSHGCAQDQLTHIINMTFDAQVVSVDIPICSGANGSTTIKLSSGYPPYTVELYNNLLLVQSTSVEQEGQVSLTALPSGSYQVQAIDSTGCTVELSFVVTLPSPLVLTVSPDQVLCYGATTTVSAYAEGGTLPYTWYLQGTNFIVFYSSPPTCISY